MSENNAVDADLRPVEVLEPVVQRTSNEAHKARIARLHQAEADKARVAQLGSTPLTEPRRSGWRGALHGLVKRYGPVLAVVTAVGGAGVGTYAVAQQGALPHPTPESSSPNRPGSTEIPYLAPPDRVAAMKKLVENTLPKDLIQRGVEGRDPAVVLDPSLLLGDIRKFRYLNGTRIDWNQSANKLITVANATMVWGDKENILLIAGQKTATSEPEIIRVPMTGEGVKIIDGAVTSGVNGSSDLGLQLTEGGTTLYNRVNRTVIIPRPNPSPVVQSA